VAETVKKAPRRATFRLSGVDAFLWVVRIGAIVIIAWGLFVTLSDADSSFRRSWLDFIIFGIAQGSVYALVALGYTMVYGVLRFINFAHGEVFMVGAMVGFQVADVLSRTSLWLNSQFLALTIVFVSCVVTSTLVAVALERVAYRPLRDAPRLIPLITAIGASFFLQYAVAGIFGTDNHNFPVVEALSGSYYLYLGDIEISILRPQALVIGTAVAMMLGLYLFVERTKAGRAIRAVSEDQEIARLMGINVDRTIALVFALGGAMAGVAAFLYGLNFGQANFFSGFILGIKAFTSAVLGGIGNIVGAMLGGLTLGIVESVGPSAVLDGLGIPATHQLKDVIAFLTLVLVLIFRPTGILGERLAEERG
jgi:branched-chain amino acid transport system permease protein